MTSQALISKIHCTLSANQKRDSSIYNIYSFVSLKVNSAELKKYQTVLNRLSATKLAKQKGR